MLLHYFLCIGFTTLIEPMNSSDLVKSFLRVYYKFSESNYYYVSFYIKFSCLLLKLILNGIGELEKLI